MHRRLLVLVRETQRTSQRSQNCGHFLAEATRTAPGPSRQYNKQSGRPHTSWPGLPGPPAGADVPQGHVSVTAFREETE